MGRAPRQSRVKLSSQSDSALISPPNTPANAPMRKPARRPRRCISPASGCKASRPPSISRASGRVARPAADARRSPTMEVKMIPVIEQDQNSAWAMNRRRT